MSSGPWLTRHERLTRGLPVCPGSANTCPRLVVRRGLCRQCYDDSGHDRRAFATPPAVPGPTVRWNLILPVALRDDVLRAATGERSSMAEFTRRALTRALEGK